MAGQLHEGQTFEKTITVGEQQAARHLLAEGLGVFSTPELIRFIEMCALEGVRPSLREGQDTVGTWVDVRHLAPTPVGMQVTARATVIQTEGRRVRFRVEVHDELEKVAEGTHERFIVDRDKQRKRLDAKLATWTRPT
jgi:predicted thioesterase